MGEIGFYLTAGMFLVFGLGCLLFAAQLQQVSVRAIEHEPAWARKALGPLHDWRLRFVRSRQGLWNARFFGAILLLAGVATLWVAMRAR